MLYRPRMLFLPDLGSCDNGQHSPIVVMNCISQTANEDIQHSRILKNIFILCSIHQELVNENF